MNRPLRLVIVALSSVALVAASCTSSSDVSNDRSDESVTNPTTGAPTTGAPSSDESDPTSTDEVEQPPTGTEQEPTTTGVPEASETGTLSWSPCPDAAPTSGELECATLVVPLDHQDPSAQMIDIAVARSRATGSDTNRVGSLVFNPGGPGGSGIEALNFLPLTMSAEIRQRFDLVSFDPRGVGRSTAVDCDADFDDKIDLLADGDDTGWAALLAASEEILSKCSAETLEIAPYLGTNSAARDLDLLREALGDDGLTYVGYSYGTRLGATYAELFPASVRALVLDGAVKPTDNFVALDLEQGGGFDRALENFAQACDGDSDCLLHDVGPTLEVLAGLEAEIEEVGSFPTDDPDRRLEPGELNLGVAAALYSKESWPFLAQALFLAESEQDGSLLQVLGDSLVGRQVDGSYDNSQTANGFINCADNPSRVSAEQQRIDAATAAEQSEYFADFLRATTGCLGFADPSDPLILGPATGAAPIVVIGSTGDPATPFEWSVELAEFLDSAVLYTVEAEGHTAYGSIDCVAEEIDAYLIDLIVPTDDATCSDNADADFFVPAGESELDQVFAFFDCLRDNGADIPAISEADVLADPTLETVLGDVDFGDPAMIGAVASCQDLIPEI